MANTSPPPADPTASRSTDGPANERHAVNAPFIDAPGRHGVGAVFAVSVALLAVFVLWASIWPENLNTVMSAASTWVTSSIGWTYLIVPLACLIFLVSLVCTRYGAIRLGKPEDRPEFSTWAWLAMILSAVMGVGLISYGVAEPISHFATPPHGLAEPETMDAAVRAMQYSYFDWGPHAWAIFAVFGLAIAWSRHRKGRSGLISPMLRPVLGKAVDGWFGMAIDIFAILATLFGTTTSLGLGASQIDEGMSRVFGTPSGTGVQIAVIAVVTVLFTLSAMSGVHRGVKYISQVTTVLGVGLAVYVLVFGPTDFVSNLFVRATGQYFGDFFSTSLLTPLSSDDLTWMQWWTYFMMAWWLSWGAFVGVFLAKISKGRTVRQFILGVLGVPTLVFAGWFTIFGGSAIKFDMDGAPIVAATQENINNAFFSLLENLPLTQITSIAALLLVALFFISGADANTYVLGMLSCKGTLYPRRSVLLTWGVLTGMCAIVLLLANGLQALQQAALLSALPFTVIVTLLGISLTKELRSDPHYHALHPHAPELPAVPGPFVDDSRDLYAPEDVRPEPAAVRTTAPLH
ncbi:BCCT family transporter [Nakamurella flava]|uniref:BCCT family transporter n=1 Tax=Nakamurella flava TaxID=2576308 RepID=A0A4U6QCS7_9ACTN|nr:BCCT family transporter [Nakamurella flava]TKV57762.1 BCCT family transporter [Nakamurella flava]